MAFVDIAETGVHCHHHLCRPGRDRPKRGGMASRRQAG